MDDIRQVLFAPLAGKRFAAQIRAESGGILSGIDAAAARAAEIGIQLQLLKSNGETVSAGETMARLEGPAELIAEAEERLLGPMTKASGVATATRRAVDLAGPGVDIVAGSWKKIPFALKQPLRQAVYDGGGATRICPEEMIYLDKNYVRMFGSMANALTAAARLEGRKKVIQLRGENDTIAGETRQALAYGADVLMVDTGRREDLAACAAELARMGCRGRVRLAFAGGILIADIPSLLGYGPDAFCIGRYILDAPLLDMRLDVEGAIK